MTEILTNLGCLWGGRGPVLQPHPLRNSGNGNLHNFNNFRLPLGGKLRSFSSWTLALGTGLPLIGGGGTVKYLTNMSRGQAIPRKSDENFKGQAIPYEYLTNTGSWLFWGEFRPSRKFSNTFDVEIPHSDRESVEFQEITVGQLYQADNGFP